MAKPFRKLLLLIFVVIFLVLAPVLILYSLGYTYNWQKNRLEKTGVLFVKSYPKGSDILIDGKFRDKTPTQITHLLPKVYEVVVTKEGYRSWQKNLQVFPQLTTFVEDVSLFFEESQREDLLIGGLTDLLVSPNENMIALLDQSDARDEILVYSTLTDEFSDLYQGQFGRTLSLLEWSFSNKKLLIKSGGDYLILNSTPSDFYAKLSEITPLTFSEVKWNRLNDNIVYGLSGGTLYEIDIIQQQTKKLTDDQVMTFIPFKSDILYLAKEGSDYFLKIKSNGDLETLFKLPSSNNYSLESPHGDYVVLKDSQQNYVYLITPENKEQPLKSLIKNITDYQWYNQRLLYWNKAELWLYNPGDNQKTLLERTSQRIESGFWHPNATHVFGLVEGQLNIYELDGRDQRNVYDLLKVNSDIPHNFVAGKKGEFIYLIGSVEEGISGFYKVKIQ